MRYYNEKIETMSRDEMTALQSARLVDVVRRTYEGAPYFRAKMDAIGLKPEDIKGIEDIAKLPFTTKADLRANYPFGCFALPISEIARVHASSGTTGKLTVVGLTNRDMMRQITLIKDFGATALACTPSYAMVIGEGIEKAGYDIKEFKLRVGIFGAEPWSENMKKEIERKLNITAYDIYGLSEISGPGVSMSCPYQCGLHVMEDFFYPEIVDPVTLQPVPDGVTGELVFTTLNKQGMPLIRYRTRDISALWHDKCECGRTLVRMKRVSGRTDDMLIIRGVNVFPSQIESVLMNIKEIVGSHYQIIVDRVGNLDTMEIQVELAPHAFSDEVKDVEAIRKRIEHDMMGNLGVGAKITLVSPDSLPLSEGKTVRIIDKRKI